MEANFSNQQLDQPVSPAPQPTPITQQPVRQSSISPFIIVLITVVVMLSLGATGYFGYQYYNLKSQLVGNSITAEQPSSTPEVAVLPAENSQADETKGWITQELPELKLEFKLPDYFAQMDYPNGNVTKGEKGEQYCIQYLKSDIVSFFIKKVSAGSGSCFPTYFGLGTTSIDYQAGRMGGFGDLQGYVIQDGKYYAKMVMGKRFEIPANLVEEITNQNGIKILRIIGKSTQPSEANGMSSLPVTGTPGDGSIGALLNFDNSETYSGVAVEMKLDEKLNEELFDTILSTFKFTN